VTQGHNTTNGRACNGSTFVGTGQLRNIEVNWEYKSAAWFLEKKNSWKQIRFKTAGNVCWHTVTDIRLGQILRHSFLWRLGVY